MRIIHYLSILVVAAVFAACSKGAAGPQGPAGTNGSSNINTSTYTVTTQWTAVNSSDVNWVSTWTAGAIGDGNNDAVAVYWSNTGTGWGALPYTDLEFAGDQLSYTFSTGYVSFTYYTGGPSWTLPPSSYTNAATLYFNIITIPPSIMVKYPGVNWNDASQILKSVPEVQAVLNNAKNK